eukprot:gb/GECG01013177.1/.p1 GENE.gb/GECG01013177.1/~~gb/GECG01013177.1/.p1  ORF type:complete len:2185 (+),score=267.87 gb/GECG01013177.1/:1-6555(+)
MFNRSGGGLFGGGGGMNTSTPFGQQPQQQGGGLFGQSNPNPTGGGGLFGSGGGAPFGQQQPQQQQQSGGNLFGGNTGSGGLFGGQSQQTQQGSGLGFGGGGGGMFGAPTSSASSSGGGLFGSAGAAGGGLFGSSQPQPQQNQAPFGGGAGTGLFGNQGALGGGLSQGGSTFGINSTANSSMGQFGSQQQPQAASGTLNAQYKPLQETDNRGTATGKSYVVISAAENFADKPLEQLRLEDYVQASKGGKTRLTSTQSTQGLQAPGMGASQANSSGGLFGGSGISAPMSSGFGQSSNTGGLFGSTANGGSTSSFGGGLFGASSQPQNKGFQSSGLFGQPASTSAFSAQAPASGGGLFSQQTSNNTNTSGGLFGSQTNTLGAPGSLFGGSSGLSTSQTTGFGSGGLGSMGAPVQSAGMQFGATSSAPMGGGIGFSNPSVNSGGLFGGANASSGFAGKQQPTLFGSVSSGGGSGFGSALFGQSAGASGLSSSVPPSQMSTNAPWTTASNNQLGGGSQFALGVSPTVAQPASGQAQMQWPVQRSSAISQGTNAPPNQQVVRSDGNSLKQEASNIWSKLSAERTPSSLSTFASYAPPSPPLATTPRIKVRSRPRGFRSRPRQKEEEPLENDDTTAHEPHERNAHRYLGEETVGDRDDRSSMRLDLNRDQSLQRSRSHFSERSYSRDKSFGRSASYGTTTRQFSPSVTNLGDIYTEAIQEKSGNGVEATETPSLNHECPNPSRINFGFIRVAAEVPAWSFFTTGAPVPAPRERDVQTLGISKKSVDSIRSLVNYPSTDIHKTPITLWNVVEKSTIGELKQAIVDKWDEHFQYLQKHYLSEDSAVAQDKPILDRSKLVIVVDGLIIRGRDNEDLPEQITDLSTVLVTFDSYAPEQVKSSGGQPPLSESGSASPKDSDDHGSFLKQQDNGKGNSVPGGGAVHRVLASLVDRYEKRRQKEPALPKLPALEEGYYTENPSIEELIEMPIRRLSHVRDFVVGRRNYGKIKFLGTTDIRGLDLAFLVTIERSEVAVYENLPEYKRPSIGEELNKPSEITLENEWPDDDQNASEEEKRNYAEELRAYCETDPAMSGAEHISYDTERGSWTFKVQHFSRWGTSRLKSRKKAPNEDSKQHNAAEESSAAVSRAPALTTTQETPGTSHPVEQQFVSSLTPIDEVQTSRHSDEFLQNAYASDQPEFVVSERPSPWISRLVAHSGDTNAEYPLDDLVDGVWLAHKEGRYRDNFASTLRGLVGVDRLGKWSIASEKLKSRVVRPIALPSLKPDPALFMRRSFRVGFGPFGMIANLGKPIGRPTNGDRLPRLEKSRIHVEKVCPWNLERTVQGVSNDDISPDESMAATLACFNTLVLPFLRIHRSFLREVDQYDTSVYKASSAPFDDLLPSMSQEATMFTWTPTVETDYERCVGGVHSCLHALSRIFAAMKTQHSADVASSTSRSSVSTLFDMEYLRQVTRVLSLINVLWGSQVDPWESLPLSECVEESLGSHGVTCWTIHTNKAGAPQATTSLEKTGKKSLEYENYEVWDREQYRRLFLLSWFAAVLSEDLELGRIRRGSTSRSRYSDIFYALLRYDIETAVRLSEESGCFRLAALISQAGTDLEEIDLLHSQYEQWVADTRSYTEMQQGFIDTELLKIYALLAGRPSEDIVEMKRYPWLVAFLLELAYDGYGSTSLRDAYDRYFVSMENDNAGTAVPWYEQLTIDRSVVVCANPITYTEESNSYRDIRSRQDIVDVGESPIAAYRSVGAVAEKDRRRDMILSLLSVACHDPTSSIFLDPSSITPFVMDSTIPWFVSELLEGLCDERDAATHPQQRLRTALTLIETACMAGRWEWGVYVVMNSIHQLGRPTRESDQSTVAQLQELAEDIISKHMPTVRSISDQWLQNHIQFFQDIGLSPVVWKKALAHRYLFDLSTGDIRQISPGSLSICGIRCCLETQMYNEAGSLLINAVGPDLMLSVCSFVEQILARVFVRRESGDAILRFLEKHQVNKNASEPAEVLPNFRGVSGHMDFHQWVEYMIGLERLAPERSQHCMMKFCRCVGTYISFLISAKQEEVDRSGLPDQPRAAFFEQADVDKIFALARELSGVKEATMSTCFLPTTYSHFLSAYHRSWSCKCSFVCLAIASDLSAHLLIDRHRERVCSTAYGSYAIRYSREWTQLDTSRSDLKRQLEAASNQISETFQ